MGIINSIKSFVGKNFLTTKFLENPELREARWNKCKSRAGKCYNSEDDTCKLCSCPMEIKTTSERIRNINKLGRIEQTHCPLGKWPVILDDGTIGGNDLHVLNNYRAIDGKPEKEN